MCGKYIVSNKGARKATYSMDRHETIIDFMLVSKINRKYSTDRENNFLEIATLVVKNKLKKET